MIAFWDIELFSLFEVDRRFGGAYYLHRPDDEAARTSETSVYFDKTARRSIPEGYRFRPRTCLRTMFIGFPAGNGTCNCFTCVVNGC
jgi:hypothetical protein